MRGGERGAGTSVTPGPLTSSLPPVPGPPPAPDCDWPSSRATSDSRRRPCSAAPP